VRDGCVVKGVRFRDHTIVGDVSELIKTYCRDDADEIVFYDITASPDGRTVDRKWISDVAKLLDIPFCVAGGIRSVADAEQILQQGADKVSINSPALENPSLISDLAKRFGSQCVVIGIDSKRIGNEWEVHQYTGDESRTASTTRKTLEWAREVQDLGAGEIVLNCMNSDGVRDGYDIDQLVTIGQCCDVPLVASGGAGRLRDFMDVFMKTNVSAALAASVFHNGEIKIPTLKQYLSSKGIEVRL
jgi:cyclase